MAAYDESDLDDTARTLRQWSEMGMVSRGPRNGSASSTADEKRESPESCQISDRELEGLLGVPPSTKDSAAVDDTCLRGCLKLVRLNDILENSDAATAGELRHIKVCPDCVSRVRAFRIARREEASKLFEGKLDLIREARVSYSPVVQEAEAHARLLFLMIGQDANPKRWQMEAWDCTRKVAAALRIARNQKPTLEEMETVLELFMTAIGTAASNPVATCSRQTDGAWPIVEMVKHTAVHVALNDPALFKAFSRHLGATIRTSTRRMKTMLTYAMVDLLDHEVLPAAFAPMLVREISACDLADAVRLVLATLLPEHSRLSADLRFAGSDTMSDPRVEDVYDSVRRGRSAIETALKTPHARPTDTFDTVLAIVERFCDDLFSAVEPEDAMLRLIALRRIVREVTRKGVRTDLPVTELFSSIAELVLERASQRAGSMFFAIEIWSVIRKVSAATMLRIIDSLPSATAVIRQGVIISIADGYAACFRGDPQATLPRFHRQHLRWEFEAGDVETQLDALCRHIAEVAADSDLDEQLHWFKKRLEIWSATAEWPVSMLL